jgi:hypothetical protein
MTRNSESYKNLEREILKEAFGCNKADFFKGKSMEQEEGALCVQLLNVRLKYLGLVWMHI